MSTSTRRRLFLAGTAALPPTMLVAADAWSRPGLWGAAGPKARISYAVGIGLSVLVWALLLEAARHPRRRSRWLALAALALIGALGVGAQLYVHGRTHGYVNRDAVALSLGFPGIILEHAWDDGWKVGFYLALPAAASIAFATLRARWFGLAGESGRVRGGAICALCSAAFLPLAQRGVQAMPPDILMVHATGGLLLHGLGALPPPRTCPLGRHEEPPRVATPPPPPRSIVLILGESVRRDETCARRTEGCVHSPRVDAAAPGRIGYSNAFATSSCTELSCVATFSGLPVTAGLDEVARAPLLWDYAKARGYRTAYFSSHNLAFENLDRFFASSRVDLIREARDRATTPSMDVGTPDETTTAEALAFLRQGPRALAVVHLANTHSPYRRLPARARREKAPGSPIAADRSSLRSRYLDALAFEDEVIGDFVAALRADPVTRDAIVAFTADHGEAFGEHGAIGHTTDLYEEQIDVPLWIDIPAGAVPDAVRQRMAEEAATRPVVLADLSVTLIDLMGGLDFPAWQPQVSRLGGETLLRAGRTDRTLLLWNCPPYRECTAESFAVRRGPLKLQYLGRESRYACHDLASDPAERVELTLAHCEPLRSAAASAIARLP